MSSRTRAAWAALVVAATSGMLAAAASPALGQRSNPEVGRAASPPPTIPPLTTPYPGATVFVDPRWYGVQPFAQPYLPQRPPHHPHGGYPPPPVYYYDMPPVYYYNYMQYAGVNDVNGQPLASYFQPHPAAPAAALGDPDLRGSPYSVIDGGAMVVDFGNGDRRAVPSCATVVAAQTPDGQPRTVFYTPPADGVVLRNGARGRVLGSPAAGARVCYKVDQYGRMVLDY